MFRQCKVLLTFDYFTKNTVGERKICGRGKRGKLGICRDEKQFRFTIVVIASEIAIIITSRPSSGTIIIDESVSLAPEALVQLRRSWLRIALVWAAVWLATYGLLSAEWAFAQRWLLLSGAALAAILWRVKQHLALNRRSEDGRLLLAFGPGNQISLFRGLLLGLLAGFLFSPWPPGLLAWIIAGIYTAASIADAFDGYAARRSGQVTELGQWLDMEFDGLGLAIVTVLAVSYGQLPLWFLAVGFARYFFVFGLWQRERHGKPIFDIPDSMQRRITAGMLMGMMTVVLWPIVPPAMAHVASFVFGIPLLAGFVRDWLFASGRLNSGSQAYQKRRQFVSTLFSCRLPLVWRILLAGAMLGILTTAEPWYRPAAWEALIQSWGLPGAAMLASLLALTAVTGTVLVALGVLGRLWAILLLFPIGFDISTAGLTWLNGLALVCALMIALFGSGPYSLWKPEEAFMVRRGGRDSN